MTVATITAGTEIVRDDFVPASDYLSAEFAAREHEAVWTKAWQIACRVEDIPEVGDYVTYELGPESVLVVRQSASEIIAYHNVCQHRGRRLKNRDEVAGTLRG